MIKNTFRTRIKSYLLASKNRKTIIITLIVLLLLWGILPKAKPLFSQLFSGNEEQNRELIADIWLANPSLVEDKIFTTGEINALNYVELRAETSGRVTGLYIREGEWVKKGQLLVKINDNDLQAELARAHNNLAVAQQAEQRQKQLLGRGAASQEDYDRAMLQLNNIEAEIKIIEANIARTEIRAPFDGVLGLKHISQGAYITPSTQIASLQDISQVRVDFFIPERYRLRVQPGNTVNFTVQGTDSIFTGKVYAVEPRIYQNTRSLRVRALSNNQHGLLSPGSFATLDLVFETHPSAIMLPSIALISTAEGYSVFRLEQDEVARVPVVPGIRTADAVQILQGIAPGDSVLISGIMNAEEGMRVNIRNINQ